MRRTPLTLYVVFLMVMIPLQTRWIFLSDYGDLAIGSVYAVQILILLGIVFAGGRLEINRKVLPFAGLGTSIGALCAVSAVWAEVPELALMKAEWFLSAVMLMVLATDKRVDRKVAFYGLLAGLIACVLAGVSQVALGSFPASTVFGVASRGAETLGDSVFMLGGERMLRAYGLFSHPNIFGGWLAVGVYALITSQSIQKTWKWVFGVFLGVGLLLTFSHAAWIGLGLALLAKRLSTRTKRVSVYIFSGFLACTILFLTVSAIGVGSVELSASISERFSLGFEWIQFMKGQPFLGSGAGNYVIALGSGADPSRWWLYQPVHHGVLLLLSELGIFLTLGLALAITFLLKPFKHMYSPVDIGAFTLILTLLFFDHYLWSQWSGVLLLTCFIVFTIKPEEPSTPR